MTKKKPKKHKYFPFWQLGFLTLVVLLIILNINLNIAQTQPKPKAKPHISRQTTKNLNQKRYIAAGNRAYIIGTGDGSFQPLGWHIKGEMGGIWSHPIKLLDGYWFALNDKWLPSAQKLTTHVGYIETDYGQIEGFEVKKIEFAPDNLPVVLVGLIINNPNSYERKLAVKIEALSELMAVYPWEDSQPQSAKTFNLKDEITYNSTDGTITFKEPGKSWYAMIGTSVKETKGITNFPPNQQQPSNQNNNGARGQLQQTLNIPGSTSTTLWLAVSGSNITEQEAAKALQIALNNPEGLLQAKIDARIALLEQTQVILPNETLQAAFDWSKLNLADLRTTVVNLQIRNVEQGKAYPPPTTTIPALTGIGAGFPDYPWYFAIDGAYTTYSLVVTGQWDTAMAHLIGIRDVSRAINGETGKVVHEIVTDGSVYFGGNMDNGNVNETAQIALAVELLWKWSGNDAFRDQMYDFIKDGLAYITTQLDTDHDGWPEGLGAIERSGMGAEHLDVAVYTIRALQALERMAQSKADKYTQKWAKNKADAMQAAFDRDWWLEKENLYADSLCNPKDSLSDCTQFGGQLQQRHWINAIPMEMYAAPPDRAIAALKRLETDTFTGNSGLYHTGVGGGSNGQGELKVWTLPNAVMAVAEANYGRINKALNYMNAIALQVDLEMPGALPEILPSPEYNPFADLNERAMFMQAWSSYGIHWPIIGHFLGIDPDIPLKKLSVIPHIPPAWPGLSVERLRLGNDTITVSATKTKTQYQTTVAASTTWKLELGHILPKTGKIRAVSLDGVAVPYEIIDSPLYRQVLIETTTEYPHTLNVEIIK